MARPRTITDARLLDAAALVVGRLGPSFTLADVAGQAEVSVGTVAQRFGSKHGLLVALTLAAIDGLRSGMPQDGSPVDALVAVYAPLDDPGAAARNLAQLAVDLADDRLRELMAEFYAVMEERVALLVRRQVDAGLLAHAPSVAVAARILTALADGTAVHWSARPVGGLCARLRADLTAVMDGWRGHPDEREHHDA
jgi:AcrR family transcriptional regulator